MTDVTTRWRLANKQMSVDYYLIRLFGEKSYSLRVSEEFVGQEVVEYLIERSLLWKNTMLLG